MSRDVDVLVVGAGFAGAVLAERLAEEHGLRCLVIDRRNHLGGLAHDAVDRHGVLLHTYGPHYFRTDSDEVRAHLDRFTAWRETAFRVLAWTDGRFWSFPVNLATFEQYLGRPSTTEEMERTLAEWRVPCAAPRNCEEYVLSRLGRPFYEKFYLGYTRKQWGREPAALHPSVCGRVPIRTSRDDRYLDERFQALPRDGYTTLFERLLDHPRIETLLAADFRELRPAVRCRHLVYTGALDEFYDFRFGPLPYRTLRFERETLDVERFQPAVQVNYPNDREFTRIVELKHATGQELPQTTIVREFPEEHVRGREPFYPVPTAASDALARRYAALAAAERDVTFLGRLATYRYLNMDQVVAAALAEARRLGPRLRAERR
jgi:UDP-galactopyranose mutase